MSARLVILGGAGAEHTRGSGESKQVFEAALKQGQSDLEQGQSSIDVVTNVVRRLEDSGWFNAGKGGDRTVDGLIELDAGVMRGSDCAFGAVTLSHQFQNPVVVARTLLETGPHAVMAEDGLISLVDKSQSDIKQQWKRSKYVDSTYADVKRDAQATLALASTLHTLPRVNDDYFRPLYQRYDTTPLETVAAIAMDSKGNLAAASSTGGRHNKLSGRIAPCISSGGQMYANNDTCAVAFSGFGEGAWINIPAFDIHSQMKYGNKTLREAMQSTLLRFASHPDVRYHDAGFIGMDKQGNMCVMYSSNTMPWGFAIVGGNRQTGGWTESK